MEKDLSVKDSLDIIQAVIDQTKQRYEQNGLTILVWGILVFVAGMIQYLMIINGNPQKSYLPWVYTMIPGFIITFISKGIEGYRNRNQNKASDRMGFIWLLAGSMAMVTGFVIAPKSGGLLITPLIWAPFCIAAFATALYLRERTLGFMSILSSIICFAAIYIPFKMHPMITSIIALLLMIIPGIKLYSDHKKRNRV